LFGELESRFRNDENSFPTVKGGRVDAKLDIFAFQYHNQFVVLSIVESGTWAIHPPDRPTVDSIRFHDFGTCPQKANF
jgi:hypothetical protein